MGTKQIVNWLRDKAVRAHDVSWTRMMHLAADRLTELDQKWISVKDEKKPKDRRNYFIAYVFGDSDMHFYGEAIYHAYEGNGVVDRPHFSNEGVNDMRVTHWMEIPQLPQPPKEENS